MPAQSDWVRVKDSITGHERSTLVVSEGEEILDKEAADTYGIPYPPKHNRPLSSLVGANGKPVDKMSVPELREFVAANGIEVDGTRPTKDDLVSAIASSENDDPKTPTATGGEDTTQA